MASLITVLSKFLTVTMSDFLRVIFVNRFHNE